MKNYIKVSYKEKPLTDYPVRLVRELNIRFWLWKYVETKVLDLGCGRGEFLKAFAHLNAYAKVEGYDSDPDAKQLNKSFKIKIGKSYPLPYKDNTFHIVFCKSVIEHQYYPEELVQEVYRILAPGGQFIVLTPDIDSIKTVFWVDFTHRTPFTLESLREILEIYNFKNVYCNTFIQLPFTWDKPKWLVKIITTIFSLFYTKNSKNKYIKYSKEKMLLAVGQKP